MVTMLVTVLGYAALAFALFWIVTDPTGAANAVAYIAHALGVAASSLEHHLSAGKPALIGVSTRISPTGRPA